MSLSRRFRNLAAAFLMVLSTVAPMGGALVRSAYAADGDPDLGVPEHSKTLTSNKNAEGNPDGTYTITLSVTGKAESTTINNGANVVVVLDTSGSMRYFLESNTGRYGTNNVNRPASINDYYETNVTLYGSREYNAWSGRYECRNEITNNTTSGPVYYQNGRNCDTYTGQRYDSSKTRLDSAKSSLSTLFSTLLGNNTAEHTNLVEVSFISFANGATLRNSWTTNSTALNSTLNNVAADGGTNWDDALRLAKSTLDGKNDGDKGYVIFMTDGNPTFYHNCISGAGCNGDDTNNYTVTTSYNNAAPQALAITNAGYNLYNLGVYGSVDRMQSLTTHANTATAENHGDAYYYAASNETAVNAAFAEIANSITNNLSLTNIEYSDGITGLTTMSVNGAAGNFKYTLGGVDTTDPRIATAKYENGEVIWDLGDYVLGNGVTATVSFTVWPSQEAYDLVADLNNGKRTYDSLTDAEKESVACTFDGNGNVQNCTLKTNTDYPTLQYQTVKNSTDGSDPVYGEVQKIELTNPSPVGLTTQKLDIVKIWEDGLDPDQQNDYNNQVVLDLYRYEDGQWKPYEANISIVKSGSGHQTRWVADKKVAVAPGIMVSVDSETGQKVKDSYPVVDGYVILEEGHEYELREAGITNHYYLTNYQYHPMLVDGEVKNVRFTRNGSTVVSVEVMDNISELSATNTLKGGIDVMKEVSGREDVSQEKFTISTIFEDSSATHTYRIFYGENNPCSKEGADVDECADENGSMERSKKKTVTGTLTADYYVGDIIRFIDVDTGTKFKVEEDTSKLTLGYEFDSVEHKISRGEKDNYVDYKEDEIEGEWHIVQKNASSRAVVKNVYNSTELKIKKIIDLVHGDTNILSKKFNFQVNLKNGEEVLEGEYGYAITNADGEEVSSGKIESGDKIELGHNETATIIDLPVGASYEVKEAEANENGFVTIVTGEESGDLSKSGAEIVYINTYDATPANTQIIALKDFNDWNDEVEDTFWFTLTDVTNGVNNEIGRVPISTSDAEKKATFDVRYTQPGEYRYTITESTDGFEERNITSEPNTLTVTVIVEDDGEGHLAIKDGYPKFEGDAENNNTITNTYESVGSLQLYASKILTGRDWQEGDEFTFRLYELVDNEEKEKGSVTITSEGQVVFTTITYNHSDVGTHIYIIREDATDIAGITNGSEVRIEVELEDDHQGNITTNFNDDEYIAEITNAYNTKPVDETLNVSKIITDSSNSKKDGTFTFELQDLSGDMVQTKDITTVDQSGSVSFNAIRFTEAGTYNYQVVEIAGNINGFTYDDTVYYVTIVVKDDTTKAQLYVDSVVISLDKEGEDTVNKIEFDNSYEAVPTEVQFEVEKALTGFEGETPATFTFKLTGDATDEITIGGSGKESFAVINYDEVGTYNYVIKEVNDGADGYTYDASEYNIKVEVKDENGALKPYTTITKNGEEVSEIKFENTYAASGDASLKITKAFDGNERDWSDESFEFELTGDEIEEAMTAEANADSNWVAVFDKIEYTHTGTYHYTITEKDSGLANVEASGSIEVTVEVVDNGDGTLTATPEYTNNATITNTYTPDSVKAKLQVEKQIDDQSESNVDGTFEFTLTGEDYSDSVEVTTYNGSGSEEFKEIEFTEAGTYTYTLKETKGSESGYTYDENEYDVVIVVKDNTDEGKLEIESITNNGKITITNVYKASATTYELKVKKTLNGLAEGLEPAVFSFELTGDATGTQTISGAGEATFGPFTYETVGTHSYKVTETKGSAGGYSYDGSIYTIDVEVVDEGGKLVAKPTIKKDGESATSVEFVNVYKAEGSIDLYVTKDVQGRPWLDSDKFEFTLFDESGEAVGEPVTVDSENKTAKFTLTYSEKDHNQKYDYTISETSTLPAGMTKPADITATVSVTDNGDGTMKIEATDGGKYTIVNSYKAESVDTTIRVNKKIDDQSNSNNNNHPIGGTFYFTLEGEGYSDYQAVGLRGGVLEGGVDFKAIEFTEAGTYTYTLQEAQGALGNFTYDTNEYTVLVVVEDNYETGKLEVKSVTIEGDETKEWTITNIYKADPVDVQFEVTKVLNGMNDGVEPVEFEFELTGDGIEEAQTVTIKGAGSEKFDPITFEQTGTYEYEIVEIDGGAAGYLYDIAKYIIEVTVTDEGGKLVADVQIKKDGQSASNVTFENNYEATPITDYAIEVNKVLEGRELREGEFSFTLYDEEGNEVMTVLNDADGKVIFDGLSFEKPDTYVFTVKENANENNSDVEFDENEYTITIVVKDNGEGELVIESDDSSDVTFTNIYHEPGRGDTPENPKTEDDIVRNIAMLAISVLGLIGTAVFGKRKLAEDEE